MGQIVIEDGIMIDETEGMLEGLNEFSTTEVIDLTTIISFIRDEFHTKFYIDNKLLSRMEEQTDSLYLWLDTGLRNIYGNPIFLSLLKKEGVYSGHYYGTADVLSENVKRFFYRNRKEINTNLSKFKRKYDVRIEKRENKYIEDENQYIMNRMRKEEVPNTMKVLLENLNIDRSEIIENTPVKKNIERMTTEIAFLQKQNMQQNSGTKVVLDLEFCAVDDDQNEMKKLSKFETIQFGAVKLDSNNEIIGRYESFVKPRYSHIDEVVSKLTHITDTTVQDAPDFINIINGFLDWAGENVTVMSWSMEDLRQLRRESRQKEFSDARLDAMFENWVDLQRSFGEEIGIEQQVSLSNAVRGMGREFSGVEHSAIDDAENTAYIYQEMQATNFKEKYKDLLDLFKPSEELTFSIGSLFGDMMKQVCCG